MPAQTSEPLPAPPAPSWSGAAIAAGAVLAGLALSRSGRVGLAAGVAAAASVKLMNGGRRDEAGGHDDAQFFHPSPSAGKPWMAPVSPAESSTTEEERDWVDSDAVFFEHVVPATEDVQELLKPKSLPLLDDEGNPIHDTDAGLHAGVLPGAADGPRYDFPLGPLIWEPGRTVQSCSDGTGETVWFGWQAEPEREDAAPGVVSDDTPPTVGPPSVLDLQQGAESPESVSSDENAIAESVEVLAEALNVGLPGAVPPPSVDAPSGGSGTGVEEAPQATGLEPLPWELPVSSPETAGNGGSTQGTRSSFMLLPDDEPEVPSAPAAVGTHEAGGETVLPQPSSMPPELGHVPSAIVPKTAVRAGLPQPRRAGELPRQVHEAALPAGTLCRNALAEPDEKHVLLTRLLPGANAVQAAPRHRQERTLAPLAPVGATSAARRWPVMLAIAMVLMVGVFLAAGWWRGGELLKKVENLPWRQWIEPGRTQAAHPDAAPPGQSTPPGRGPWLSATPEP